MDDSTKWPALRQLNVGTLETLEEARLLRDRRASVYERVTNEWLFPLFSLDLREGEVDLKTLRKAQRNWPPE
jgi:hypothetical protein